MREIKFRTWNKSEDKMYYNAELTYDFGMNGSNVMEESFGGIITNDDFILMQYTGLKDINGKEIYEGDIVKFLDEVTIKEKGYLDRTAIIDKIGVVAWDNEELGYNVNIKYENEYHYLCCCEEVEVIGNRFENPELLKEVE